MRQRFVLAMALALASGLIVACDRYKDAPPGALATASVCPVGEEREQIGPFSADCVRDLFGQPILLPKLDDSYRQPTFRIYSPVQADQLEAIYGTKDLDEDKTLRFFINPIGVNRFELDRELKTVNGIDVEIGETGEENRKHYYWEWRGWWYTIESTAAEEWVFDRISEMIDGDR